MPVQDHVKPDGEVKKVRTGKGKMKRSFPVTMALLVLMATSGNADGNSTKSDCPNPEDGACTCLWSYSPH